MCQQQLFVPPSSHSTGQVYRGPNPTSLNDTAQSLAWSQGHTTGPCHSLEASCLAWTSFWAKVVTAARAKSACPKSRFELEVEYEIEFAATWIWTLIKSDFKGSWTAILFESECECECECESEFKPEYHSCPRSTKLDLWQSRWLQAWCGQVISGLITISQQ